MNITKEVMVYWTTKNGDIINVDDMTEQHAKNTLKMLIRQMSSSKKQLKRIGNIERQFLERELEEEINYLEDMYDIR